ncbi:MAG: type I DNA topoisomerase [Acidobacteriota bacterium]|nr:MAG: type I DNA topoisomerase [Acidobacteriota bacterium]
MSKSLVIVESPSKAKTINKYLGKDFKVIASVGHIMDLPKKGLGVDVEKDFEPTYEVMPGKEKVVREIKEAAKAAETIYVATDPDREGEAIGRHIAEVVTSGRGQSRKAVFRVMFNEITRTAVQEAFKHPGKIDDNLVDAQQARRVLDRLVGYKVSPLLWDKVRRGLSAGRVQTVAVRLVVEREREIQAFVKTEYWSVVANLSAKLPPSFDARLYKIADKTVKTSGFDDGVRKTEVHITDEGMARKILKELEGADYIVSDVTTKEKKRNPVPPFITSKLQQEASRKLRFSAKKTMQIAQKLYEGKELGKEGAVGLITYMRTDSTRVSDTALGEVRDFITRQYGEKYLPEKAVFYRSKKDAQDAHEAIRPTGVDRTPDSLSAWLDKDELALYRLIWQRFVASQMMPAIFDQTTIDIAAAEKFLFRATGSVIKFDGFLAVYEEGKDEKDEDDEERAAKLPKVEKGESLRLNSLTPNQHFTEPPPRYTEATLVKALEEKGIGRPSTYASIMSVIQDREYVEKLEGRFRPTELGTLVNDLLIESFADLFNVEYTARMEEELDEIEEGKMRWTAALREFYDKFTVDLKAAQKHMRDVKRQEIITDEECDKCGSKMAIKFGRFGQFLACTNYPECKNTRDLAKPAPDAASTAEPSAEAAENPYADETCEKCGRPMTLKRGRFGQFLACTGYPECKNTRKITKAGLAAAPVMLDELCPVCASQLAKRQGPFGEFTACSRYPECKFIKRETTGVPCPRPGCKGELLIKKSKRGKAFYGCSEYPTCDQVFWDKPVLEACPQCSRPFLLEKYNAKKNETLRYCSDENCGYKSSEGETAAAKKAPAKKKATKSAGD